MGYGSCYDTGISKAENIYVYGSNGGTLAVISDISNNVYCNSYQACKDSMVDKIGNNVIGSGYQALGNATISNVNNSVVGIGYQSLKGSTINNVTNIYCNGMESCSDSKMSNFQVLKTFGTNALSGTTLVGNSSTGNVTIEINGTNYNGITVIYCTENTLLCHIDCQSSGSCSRTILYCTSQDQCIVTGCNDTSSIRCPAIIYDRNLTIDYSLTSQTSNGSVCTDARSCTMLDSIVSSISQVSCDGYASCEASANIIASDGVFCGGSYSCSNVGYIYSSGALATCGGLFSCAFVDLFEIEHGLRCVAELSCYKSNFIVNTDSNTVECDGDKSCAESSFEINCPIYLFGYFAAENAIISANGIPDNDMEVYFGVFAPGALSGAEIICGDNTTCQFVCYNYGCSDIKSIECDNCVGIEFDCEFSEKNVYCPDGMFALHLFFCASFCILCFIFHVNIHLFLYEFVFFLFVCCLFVVDKVYCNLTFFSLLIIFAV